MFALLVLALPLALGDDRGSWPQWRGLNRDGVAHNVWLPRNWLEREPPVRWRVSVGEGYSTPLIAGNRVFTFGRVQASEVIQSHDLATGKVLWRSAYLAPYEARDIARSHGAGPRATPILREGLLFTFGINEVLHALDATTGQVLWRIDFSRRFGTEPPGYGACSSPILVGRLLIVPAAERVFAVDWRSGSIVWQALHDSFFSSLILASFDGELQLVAFARYRLVGLDPNRGRLLWSHRYPSMWGSNVITPVVWQDRVIVSSPTQGARALQVSRKNGEWQTRAAWGTPSFRAYLTSPVVHEDHMYGLDESGRLHCIDLRTGRTAWSHGNFGDFGTLVRAGDQLLILNGYGEITMFEATPRGFREQGQREVANSATWAHLVVVPGSLLVRDKNELTCFDLSS